MNTHTKYKGLLFLSSAVFILTLMCLNSIIVPDNSPQISEEDNNTILEVKSAGFWYLTNRNIHIDGNWSASTTYSWISGSGTYADPFLIENVTMNAHHVNSTIIISNTDEYFKINNCTLINSTRNGITGSILLNNVSNGLIMDVEMYNGGYGIWINDTSNITISDCYIKDHHYDGIYLGYSNNITIKDGTDVYNSTWIGINFEEALNNTVAHSAIRYCDQYGIYLDNASENNWIYENYVGSNLGLQRLEWVYKDILIVRDYALYF